MSKSKTSRTNYTITTKLILLSISVILVTNLVTFAQEAPRISASKSSATTIYIRPKIDLAQKPRIATGATLPPPPKIEKPPLKVEMPEMVEVAGGTFLMGVLKSDSDNGPEHKALVPNFEISKYPITNKQFKQFVEETKYKTEAEKKATSFEERNKISWRTFATDRDNYPVVWISYNDAQNYAAWLTSVVKNPPVEEEAESEEDGETSSEKIVVKKQHPYRLPTEAEWEYAARGGLERANFPWPGELDKNKINYNSDSRPNTIDAAKKSIKAVGYQPANNFGIQDLVGNVAQWCYDWYDPSFYEYSPEPPDKAYGPEDGKERVIRGGSWLEDLSACQVSSRQSAPDDTRTAQVGFRIIRLTGQSKKEIKKAAILPKSSTTNPTTLQANTFDVFFTTDQVFTVDFIFRRKYLYSQNKA